MRQLILIAVRNLLQSRRRTLLLGIAIASVTALLVILTSVGNGIQDTMLRAATTLSTGHVNVAGFYKITSGQAAPVVVKYGPIEALVREKVPEADVIVDRLRGWGKVVSAQNSLQLGISGVDVAEEANFPKVLQVTSGSLDELKKPDTALLFESQAERLEVQVGDMVTLSAPTVRGANNTKDVTVAAVAKDIGFISSFSMFVPKATVRDLYTLDPSATGAIQIYLKDVNDADAVAERLRAVLSDAGHPMMEPQKGAFWQKFPIVTREDWTGQKLDVTTWKDEMQFLEWTIATFNALTFVLVSVLMVIILVGVMNSMWMAIRERTREIGTLRAIGMGRGGVRAMFVVEAAVLSFSATILGSLVGVGVTALLNALDIPLGTGFQLFLMRDTLRLVVDPPGVVTAIVVIASLVTLFSLYPASKAARMRPVTAMHHVG